MIERLRKFFNKIIFWIKCARAYTIPIVILNWGVIFIYSLTNNGNAILGIIALVGVSFLLMATNLIDDYFDYKILIQDEKFMNTSQNCKCKYLKDNLASLNDLKKVIFIILAFCGCIGAFLFFTSGFYVAIISVIALFFVVFYQKFSLKGLGEIIIIIMYGPLLFEGIYYVMTSAFSYEVLFLSLACSLFTNTILYTHMLMDFDGDEQAHKTTLCRKFKTKDRALKFIFVFYLLVFLMISVLIFLTKNFFYLLSVVVVPMIFDLYNSLYLFNKDKTNLPQIRFWHFPLDSWEKIKNTKDAPFYFRFFYSRNINVIFMITLIIAILTQNILIK